MSGALFERSKRALLAVALMAGGTDLVSGQASLSNTEFKARAADIAATTTIASMPGTDFGQVSLILFAVRQKPAGEHARSIAAVTPQMWVSPNLSIFGSVGSGRDEDSIVRLLRMGVRYLPEILIFGDWAPEITLAQTRVEGLREMGVVKWNEFRLGYAGRIGKIWFMGGLQLLRLRIFTESAYRAAGVDRRLERSVKQLMLSMGYDITTWARLSGQLAQSGLSLTPGLQLSIAL